MNPATDGRRGPRAAVGRLRLALGTAIASLATAFAASHAEAADICITPDAQKIVNECPGGPGQLKAGINKKPAVSFKTAPPPPSLKKRDDQLKPNLPQSSMMAAQRDLRRQQAAARVIQLLLTEIQGLERLFASTPKNSPDRPKLARRLAEDYVELEASAFRDKTEAQIKLDEAKRKNPGGVKPLQAQITKSDKTIALARAEAIRYYTLIKNQYPNYKELDEVLYYLAYEYEQSNDLNNARKVYYELIQKAPQSKYIPNAYLAFGELFFNEAQGDPSKWKFAEDAYKEVIKYPPPDNKVWGYAHYKLGYVYWNKGEFPQALSEFKKTVEYGVQYSSLPNASQLAQSARRDIIPLYALAGDPTKAFEFLRPLSGDCPQGGGTCVSTEKTIKMMDDLGQNYLDTGHYKEGIALYHDLMTRDRGPNFCKYQTHVSEATLAMKSGDKGVIKAELDRQLEVYKKFMTESHGENVKLKCANNTAGLLSETAMAWHLEAVGSGGVRGTNDKRTMELSAQIYKMVVDSFKQEQFAKFEFPRIVKEDWPNIFKIKYAMADLLYFQKDWEKCGPAFDSVVAEDPKGPQAAEAAYAAVLCYQEMYAKQHAGGSDRKGTGNIPKRQTEDPKKKKDPKAERAKWQPKNYTDSQKGMLTAFNRYVCYIKPTKGDKEAYDQYVEVKFARARTYYEAQHWEEASLAFLDVATTHADHDSGVYAANLYLETVNVLLQHSDPPRPACATDLSKAVPKFIELYCKGGKEKDHAEQCGVLNRVQCDIQRLKAEKTVELADQGTGDALRRYEEAAGDYMNIWKTYGEPAIAAKQTPQCEKLEEVLYNAARAYQAARLIAKAISVRRILIDPKWGFEKSELAKKAIHEIGGNFQAIAVYDEAANWYERYASENPKAEKAAEALQDATVLRLGLGQEDRAIRNADVFMKNYGASKAAESARINFAIAAHYVEKEDWDNARKKLSGALGIIDRSATFDVQVQAHQMMGLVYTKINNNAQAGNEYNKVRNMWKDPAAGMKKLEAIGGDQAEKDRRLGKVLTSVGEALFFFAEQKKKEVDRIVFPEYKGPGNREEVMKHINTKVKDWIAKKRPAIEGAEKEYLKILDLQPLPPPRWVIAAGSQVGHMWGRFVAEFRAAPIPKEWKGNGIVPGTADLTYAELRGNYYAALDEASEPQKQMAKAAYKKCLDYSVKYQYFDEFSRKCEVWLSKTYSKEFHAVDEFRGSPSLLNSGLSERPFPLDLFGKPVVPVTVQPADKDDKGKDKKPADAKQTAKAGK